MNRMDVGVLTALASVVLLAALGGPALAEEELCGPYHDRVCPESEVPNGDPNAGSDDPSSDPNDDPEAEQEAPDEVEGVLIEDDEAAVPQASSVMGEMLARTGVDAWIIALLGSLLIVAGAGVLVFHRRTSEPGG